ncbi:MAG: S1 RNA-binding domain-containing protein [Solirubrobacteraceae bacterium]|nr:S1 RNA-binding domain-containing protein [Patulibacter sp.]
MSEAPSTPTAHWVQDDAEIATLAAQVVDPARERLLVCVTTQPSRERPYVDPDELARQLEGRADVWAITASEQAWALTEALPPKIDVYGGAVRAWTPIPEGKEIFPSDHPQWTVFSEGDAARVTQAVVEYASLAENPPPEFGSAALAKVTAVRKAGAELELSTGHPAFASNQHLVQAGEVYHAREILQVGQEVEVRVGPWHPQAMRISVSLRDYAPDPWQRLEDQYAIDSIIEVIVTSIQPFGAFVELLPGAEGLLHKSKIADEFVHYVDDFVRPGDRIAVRLLSLDPEDRKAEVSLLDVPEGATPVPLASVYEGGPGWLPDTPGGFDAVDEAEAAAEAAANPPTRDTPGAVPTWDAVERERAEADALRARVAELEAQLVEVTAERDALRGDEDREVAAAEADVDVTSEVDAGAVPEVGSEVEVDAAPAVDADAEPPAGADADPAPQLDLDAPAGDVPDAE